VSTRQDIYGLRAVRDLTGAAGMASPVWPGSRPSLCVWLQSSLRAEKNLLDRGKRLALGSVEMFGLSRADPRPTGGSGFAQIRTNLGEEKTP
jgi:hypothetical protein